MGVVQHGAPASVHPALHDTREALTRFLFLQDAPVRVDLSFVLGCPDSSTVIPAVELYRRGLTERILISGMGPAPQATPESELFKAYAIAQGVPDAAIHLETQATNTLENFIYARRVIADQIGWDAVSTVAITAKPFHMRRALMTARLHWPSRLNLVMIPAAGDPSAETWWQTESGRQCVLSELEAIGRYALRGHIGGF